MHRLLHKVYFIGLFCIFIIVGTIARSDNYTIKYYDIAQRNLSEDAFKTGYYYFNNMNYEASIDFFRKSLEYFPRNDKTYYWLGKAYLYAGYKTQAILTWEELQKTKQNSLFLQEQLNKLYSEDLKKDNQILPNNNYVFLRYLSTNTNPINISVDNENNFYVCDFYKNKIDIYDSNLKKKQTLTLGIQEPTDVEFYGNFMIVSSFGNDKVIIYDAKTYKKIFEIGGFGFFEGKLAGPMGIAISDQKIYIVDQGNNRVQVFQLFPKPYFIASFGKKGNAPGEFFVPTDIVAYKKTLWVLDKGNARIQVFDLNGNYLTQLKDPLIENPNKIFVYNNNIYFVDANNGLLSYNVADNTFSKIKKPAQGIEQVSSAAIDKNGVIFFSEVTNPKIVAYVTDSTKLSSLNLQTLFVSPTAFPLVALKIRVQDKQGNDIIGLTNKNFSVNQDGYPLSEVNVSPIDTTQNKLKLTLVIRNAKDMLSYKTGIENYIHEILGKLTPNDEVRLIAYGLKIDLNTDFTTSKLFIEDKIRKLKFNADNTSYLDQALYTTINTNVNNDSNNAIILIDDNLDKTSFSQYTPETIGSYAKLMGIPFYNVMLGNNEDNNISRGLKYIAQESGGQSLSYYESNNIYNIINSIKTNLPLFYTLSYDSPSYNGLTHPMWANVVVSLNYRSLYGRDEVGYYVPVVRNK